ncbi:MAG: ABC transporter ATP-binding protein [Rubrivivax sp. SCN 71-131]|jgi:branched-chain amino acid transport system ATP-binding protein|nr:MAG: ABC transporter ATP-binding protein [Rubrivivax sp. SCN 71-131]
MNTPLLQVRELHAGYGRAEVLTGLDFGLAQGQVVTVIGPNGAGKSTTLAALMGVLPARGQIVFDGHDLADRTLEERVMLGLALVPEKRELFGTMPVQDNLILGGYRSMKLRVPNWQREIERVYELFPRLKERRAQLAGTLSGGERQMLAVGRALMSAPKLLMLDEPSLGLAPLIVREIFRIIQHLREQGTSILLVEQNARAALEVADHGYVLETGSIVLQGPAAGLARDPRVIDTYLGAAGKTQAGHAAER